MTSSWLQLAQQNDTEAWKKLVGMYSRLVRWWCRKAGVTEQDIDDVVQEVFSALALCLPKFEHRSFRGMLWAITGKKISDHWRRVHRRPEMSGGVQESLEVIYSQSSALSSGQSDEATAILLESVIQIIRTEFSERDWKLFWAYAVEERAAGDVANEMHVSKNQVFLAKSRVLQRIRSEFGEFG